MIPAKMTALRGAMVLVVALVLAAIGVLLTKASDGRFQGRQGEPALPAIEVESRLPGREGQGIDSRPNQNSEERTEVQDAPTTTEIGTLVVLDSITQAAISHHTWHGSMLQLKGADARRKVLSSNEAGRIALPVGRWRMASANGSWVFMEREIEIRQGQERVTWAQAVGTLEFEVVDLDGKPIEGVAASWHPKQWIDLEQVVGPEELEAPTSIANAKAHSDGVGRVRFEGVPYRAGTATFERPGYAYQTWIINQAQSGRVRIRMHPSEAPGRIVGFVSIRDQSRIDDFRITTVSGRLVAKAGQGEFQLSLPDGFPTNEPLVVRAPGIFPTLFVLDAADCERIPVFGSGVTTLLITSEAARQGEAVVAIRQHADATANAVTWPLFTQPLRMPVGEKFQLDLPIGVGLAVTVTNDYGEYAEERFSLGGPGEDIALMLGIPRPSLEISVLGVDSNPLCRASASVFLTDGREVNVVSDESGTLRIPQSTRASWIWVESPGYSRASLMRAGKPKSASHDSVQLQVRLRASIDAGFVVRDQSGAPLSGIKIMVRRDKIPDELARPVLGGNHEGSWEVQDPRHVTGITDDKGRFLAPGVVPGLVAVHLALPEVRQTAESDQTYSQIIRGLEVKEGALVEISARGARPLALEVFDASSGLPVREFTLLDGDRGRVASVAGYHWEGWIEDHDGWLDVIVVGSGQARLRIQNLSREKIERIEVAPTTTTSVQVSGLEGEATRLALSLVVMRQGSSSMVIMAEIPLHLDAEGRANLALPMDGRLEVGLKSAAIADGRSIEFVPQWREWTVGGVLQFHKR